MRFVDYKQKVMVWRKLVMDSIPSEKQGLMLLGELPLKDKFGGLQGIEALNEADGVDKLLNYLEKILINGTKFF